MPYKDDFPIEVVEHRGEPAADYDSKTVLLRGRRGDSVAIEGHGEFEVSRRKDSYMGPELYLSEDGEGHTHRLISGDIHEYLRLWEVILNERDFIEGWRYIGEVKAELITEHQYNMCKCGEPIKNQWHQSQAMLEVGEHG